MPFSIEDLNKGNLPLVNKFQNSSIRPIVQQEDVEQQYRFNPQEYQDYIGENIDYSRLQYEGGPDEQRAQFQSSGEKFIHGLAKGAGLAATTFVSPIANIYGTEEAIRQGELNKVYDNEISNKLDEFNKNLEEWFPNYYTQQEQNADAFSPDNWFTMNFLADKLIKNAGFTVGAIGIGGVTAKAIQGLGKLAMAGRTANELQKVTALASEYVSQGMNESKAITEAIAKVAPAIRLTNAASQAGALFTAAGSEASMEALQTKQETEKNIISNIKDKKLKDYLTYTGKSQEEITQGEYESATMLSDAEIAKAKDMASAAGNVAMGVNMALLMGSDYAQFGKLFKGFKEEKRAIGEIIKDGNKFVSADKVDITDYLKPLIGAGTEAFQEGSQFVTQKAAKDYYSRKYDADAEGKTISAIDSVVKGLEETFGTKEGLESMLLGALTGGLTGIATGESRGNIRAAKERVEATQQAANKLNDLFSGDKFRNAVRSVSLMDDMQNAAQSGDKFQFLNSQNDLLKSTVYAADEYGKIDALKDQITDLQHLPKEEFAKMFDIKGEVNPIEYVTKVKQRVDELQKTKSNIDDRFSQYSPAIKEVAFDIVTNIQDRGKRIQELESKLVKSGIPEIFEPLMGLVNSSDQNEIKKHSNSLAKIISDNEHKFVAANISNPVADAMDLVKLKKDEIRLAKQYKELITPEGINKIQSKADKVKEGAEISKKETIKANETKAQQQAKDQRIKTSQQTTQQATQQAPKSKAQALTNEEQDLASKYEDDFNEVTPQPTSKKQEPVIEPVIEQAKTNWNKLINDSASEKELNAVQDQIDKANESTPELTDSISKKRESFNFNKIVDLKKARNKEIAKIKSELSGQDPEFINFAVNQIQEKYDLEIKKLTIPEETSTETTIGYQDPIDYTSKTAQDVEASLEQINEELVNDTAGKEVDDDGNLIVESNKIENGANAMASLSRGYTLTELANGKKSIQDIDDLLNENFDKILLSYNKFQPGTEVTLTTDDNYDGEIYTGEVGDTKFESVSWNTFVNELRVKYGDDYKSSREYIENVPIRISNKDNLLEHTYLHATSWINENHVTGNIEQDRQNSFKIRQYIVANNGSYTTKITSTGNGALAISKEGFKPISLMTDDKNIQFATVDGDGTLNIGKGFGNKFEGKLLNKSTFTPGTTVFLARINKNNYLAIPVKKPRISESLYSEQIAERIESKIKSFLNGEITIAELRDEVKLFVNNYNTNGRDLKDIEKNLREKYNTEVSFFNINGGDVNNNIAYFYKGDVYEISTNTKNKQQIDRFFKSLRSAILNTYVQTNIDAVDKNSEVVFNDGMKMSYNEFVRDTSLSNVLGFEVDKDSSGNPIYTYTIQKVIRLDFKDILADQPEDLSVETVTQASDSNQVSVTFKTEEDPLNMADHYNLDDFDLPSTNQSLLIESSSKYFIPQLGSSKQIALERTLANDVIKKAFSGEKVVKNEVFDSYKNRMQGHLNEINKFLSNPENAEHKYRNKYEKLKQSLEAAINGWDIITRNANEIINSVKEIQDSDELDSIDNVDQLRASDYDASSIEKNPFANARPEVKMMLSGIADVDSQGNPKKNWIKETIDVDYRDVMNSVCQWCTDMLHASFDDMLVRIKDRSDEAGWVKNLIERLESFDIKQQNLFTRTMRTSFYNPTKIGIDNKNGKFTANRFSPAKDSSYDTIIEKWKNAIKNTQLSKVNSDNEYVFNKDVANELRGVFEKLQKDSEPDINILKEWLKVFGIEMNGKSWDRIKEGGLRINGKKVTFKESLKNSYSPFVILYNSLKFKDEKVSIENNNPIDETAVKKLAQFVAKREDNTKTSSVRSGGKNIFPFNKVTYLSNKILELTQNENLRNELLQLAFNRRSYWLNEGYEAIKANMNFGVADLEAIKKMGDYKNGEKKINSLSDAEYEVFSLGLLHSPQEDKSGKNKRIISLLYPTQSDKTTAAILGGIPAFLIDFNENAELTNEVIERIYQQLVLPEIERIKHFQQLVDSGVDINISGLNKGWNKFLMFPAINKIDNLFVNGKLNIDIQKETKDSLDEVLLKEQILSLIRDNVNQLVESKLSLWEKTGVTKEGSPKLIDHRATVGTKFKDKLRSKALATDMVVQYLVGNANSFMTIVEDPALFYKSKSNDPTQQSVDTFINVGKRLASNIAPREESGSGTYKQALVKDRAIDSMNIGQYKFIIGESQANEYSAKKLLSEGTNAQEFVTLSEQLERLFNDGLIDDVFYKTAIDEINNQITKENPNYYYTEQVKAKLAEVNPKYSQEFDELVLQVEKPLYSGSKTDFKLQTRVMYYIKSSAYALTPELTKGNDLDNIRIAMEKQSIARLAFESGCKLGFPTNAISLWNEDGTIKDAKDIDFSNSFVVLDRKNFGIQQVIPYDENKKEIVDVSQARKNSFLNLGDVDGFEFNGKKYSGAELEKEYMSIYKQIYDIQKEQFADEIGYDLQKKEFSDIKKGIDKLKDILLKEIIDRDYPLADRQMVELDKNLKFLAFSASAQRFESLMNSIVQNRVLKIKFPGKSFVLSTEEGYQSKGKAISEDEAKDIQGIIYTSNYSGSLKPQRIVKKSVYNESGVEELVDENYYKNNLDDCLVLPAQITVPWKFRDNNGKILDISKFVDKKTGKINDKKLPRELREIFGMRIPNQGLNSQSYIEIVGFLPHKAGDICVATRDYLAQMGSDFDVDKLYSYMFYTFYNEKSGNLYKFRAKKPGALEGISEEKIDKNSLKKELVNSIIDIHMAIHKNPDIRVQSQIFEPLGTWEFEKLAKFIENSTKSATDFNPMSDQYQKEKRLNAASAKDLVGIFSNLSMFNAVAQGKGLKFTSEDGPFEVRFGEKVSNGEICPKATIDTYEKALKEWNKIGMTKKDILEKSYVEKNKIHNILPQEDIVYPSKIITGMQSCAVDGEKLQVCDKFNWDSFTSKFANTLAALGFGQEVALFTAQPIIKELVNRVSLSRGVTSEYESDVVNKRIKDLKKSITEDPKFSQELYDEKFSNGKGLSISNMKSAIEVADNPDYMYIQLAALEQYEKLDPYASMLSAAMGAINTDSAGIQKNYFESLNKQANIEKVKYGAINIDNIEKLLQDNINQYASDILIMNNDVWGKILPYKSKGLNDYINNILSIMGKQELSIARKAELQKQIFDEIKSYFYSSSELELTSNNITSERERLFYGDSSLAKVISKLQESEQWKNHPFIGKLIPVIETNGLPSYVKINAANDEIIEKSIVTSIYDMLINNRTIEGYEREQIDFSKNINIYSTEKNGFEKLSNLLNGPIKTTMNGKELIFKTVEHLYQTKKALFAGDKDAANKIYSANTGFDAQRLGKTIKGLDSKKWDKISSKELEASMRLAFEQNPEARNLLEKTSNYNLIHKGKFNLGKWETEFPRILMEIRSDLFGSNRSGYTTKLLIDDLVLSSYLSGGIQRNEQYIKYIPASYLFSIPFAEKMEQLTGKFNDADFMQLGKDLSFKELPNFIVQYFQHNPNKVRRIGISSIFTELSKDIENEFVYVHSEGDTFLTLDKPGGKRGEFDLYAHTGKYRDVTIENEVFKRPIYKRIPILGYKQFNEYNANLPKGTIQNSVINKNKAATPVVEKTIEQRPIGISKTYSINETKSVIDELEIKSGDVNDLQNTLDLIAVNKNVDPYYALIARELSDNIDKLGSVKFKVSNEISGRGKYNESEIVFNPENDTNKTINGAAQALIHETLHWFTNKHIQNIYSGKTKGYTTMQLNALNRLKNLQEEYKTKVIAEDKAGYDKFVQDYETYKKDRTKTPTFTQEQMSKYYAAYVKEEFVTMAMTDPEFQKILNSIPAKSGSMLDKFINEIKNLLSKFLGIEINKGSALEVALEDVLTLIREKTNTEDQIQNIEENNIIKEISVPTKSSKKVEYTINKNTVNGIITEKREGYKINIKEYPDTKFYITKEGNYWIIQDVTTGYAFPIRWATNINDMLHEFAETANKQSKNNHGLKALQSTGLFTDLEIIDTLLPSTISKQDVLKHFKELNSDGTQKVLIADTKESGVTRWNQMIKRAQKINKGQNYYHAKPEQIVMGSRNYYKLSLTPKENVSLLDKMMNISDQEVNERIKYCKGR